MLLDLLENSDGKRTFSIFEFKFSISNLLTNEFSAPYLFVDPTLNVRFSRRSTKPLKLFVIEHPN